MAFKTSKEVPNRLAMIPIHDFVFQKNICYTFQPKIGEKKKISLFFAPNAIVLLTSDHDIYIYIYIYNMWKLETCENHEGFFDINIENGALWGGKIAHMLYVEEKTIEAIW